MRNALFTLLTAGAVLVATSCDGDGGNGGMGPTGGTPDAIDVVSGNNQTADRGSQLAQPLVVEVTDNQGNPVSGATVTWAVTSGSGALAETSTATDGQGRTSNTFQLPFVDGQTTVTASVSGVSPSASFTITATDPGPIIVTVDMSGIAFVAPLGGDDITIKLGDTVRWENQDGVLHTATSNSAPAGGASFASGPLSGGDSFEFTPGVAGTWVYFCEFHPTQMQNAQITVQ